MKCNKSQCTFQYFNCRLLKQVALLKSVPHLKFVKLIFGEDHRTELSDYILCSDPPISSDLYGKGSAYNCMAGREASRAMAKLSFQEADLSSTRLDDLGAFERGTLDEWVEKFEHYKNYPIVGRCRIASSFDSLSSNLPVMTREELRAFKGYQDVPSGRIHAPIYLGIKGMVLDVSFGGVEMYGKDGPYHVFAGIDASRALAKMSFEKEDVESVDLSDLTEEQMKTLDEVRSKLKLIFIF